MNEEMKTQDEALEQETSLQEEAQQTSAATNQEVSSSDELAEGSASEPTPEERLQSELDKLKEIVLDKDERAFVTINAVHDIVGGRFKKKAIH